MPTLAGVWLYTPSLALAIIATAVYAIPTLLHFYLTVFKYRTWYFIWVLIGAVLEVTGYAARIGSTRNYDSVGPYAIQSTLIILAPLFVAASNYLLLSRLILAALPPSPAGVRENRIFGISPAWLTDIFVLCDIITFIVQASGAAIVACGIKDVGSSGSVQAGNNILIAGLSIQVVTFGVFIAMTVRFHRMAKARGQRIGRKEGSVEGWVRVLMAIYVSSGCILVRTVYRLVEFAMGIDGYPFNHEWIFYVFESLPMLPAIAIFCVFHPGKYLPSQVSRPANNLRLESRSTGD